MPFQACREDSRLDPSDQSLVFPFCACAPSTSSPVEGAFFVVKNERKLYRPWTRQQKRTYQRSLSCLRYWQSSGHQVLWVMLSSSAERGLDALTEDFHRLRQEIERKLGFVGIEFLRVTTSEGWGVIHCYIAWKGPRTFFIPQRWLSFTWSRIHSAPVVWVRKVRTGQASRRKLSRYIVSQYLADQDCFVRMSYSWKKTFGFGIGKLWAEWRKLFSVKTRLHTWGALLDGERVARTNGEIFSLQSIRAGWSAFNACYAR